MVKNPAGRPGFLLRKNSGKTVEKTAEKQWRKQHGNSVKKQQEKQTETVKKTV